MKLYVDSSVIVSILLQQPQWKVHLSKIDKAKNIYSSHLLEAEVLAALTREKLPPTFANFLLHRISLVFVEQSLINELTLVFSQGYCRGADAMHMATALSVDPQAEKLIFFSADQKQKTIAKKLGFKIV